MEGEEGGLEDGGEGEGVTAGVGEGDGEMVVGGGGEGISREDGGDGVGGAWFLNGKEREERGVSCCGKLI